MTITVYVLILTPSCAVTIVAIGFGPRFSVIGAEAVPLATALPFTETVACVSAVVGFSVMVVVLLFTETV